jgi:hypothetical protein
MSLAGELAGPIQLVVHRGDGKRFVVALTYLFVEGSNAGRFRPMKSLLST